MDVTAVLEIIAKLFGLLASVFTLFKLSWGIFDHRTTRLREEYKFAKEYLVEVVNVPSPHPYLVEKGFAAISGKDNLTAAEILFFLSQPNPSLSLKRYTAARQRYVKYSESDRRVNFQGKFGDATKRKRSKIFNGLGYAFYAILSLVPLFFASNIFGHNVRVAAIFIVMFLVAFGPQAAFCLIEVKRLVKGEKLVEGQRAP